ncbi:hypothetical protein [Acetobacter pasteurianus]|uniref:hypothetical protein n=1 Tax=Acetobacter pasteurianus TaxID=438 RepID=UPI003D14BE3B
MPTLCNSHQSPLLYLLAMNRLKTEHPRSTDLCIKRVLRVFLFRPSTPLFRPFALASLFFMGSLAASAVARADDDPPPRTNVPNVQLQKELAVLHFKPEAASPACIDALKELHKTQDMLKAEEARSHDQDLAIAEDVLESDFENSIEMCAPDVQRLCEAPNPSAELAHTCEKIDSLPDSAN